MGQFVLHRKDIVKVAVVTLGPYVIACLRFDQLRGNAQSFAGTSDTSFDDVLDAQFAPDAPDIDCLVSELERRVSRNHEQRTEPRQLRDDVFGDAVAEVLLLWIAAQVGEGQDSNRWLVVRRSGWTGRNVHTGRRRRRLVLDLAE